MVVKITDDLDVLLAFYDNPAEHWVHLRTTTPIESTFATCGCGSGSPRDPAHARPVSRWRSSSSSPLRPAGVPSTHPTSSPWSAPAPDSNAAPWSNDPTNQEEISKSRDTPIPTDLDDCSTNSSGRRTGLTSSRARTARRRCRTRPLKPRAWRRVCLVRGRCDGRFRPQLGIPSARRC